MNFDELQTKKLWESAEHWLNNWEYPLSAATGSLSCPCCLQWPGKTCQGCPVHKYTEIECDDTPWSMAANLVKTYQQGQIERRKEVKASCEAEYKFLVELALGETPSYMPEEEEEEEEEEDWK